MHMDSEGQETAELPGSSEGEILVKMCLGPRGVQAAGCCGVPHRLRPPGDLAHRLSLESWW